MIKIALIPLLSLSFCVKTAELVETIKCIDYIIPSGSRTFANSIYKGLKQLRNNADIQNNSISKEEDGLLKKIVCEFNKFNQMLEEIEQKSMKNGVDSNGFPLNEYDEFDFKVLISITQNNDPALSQVLNSLISAQMSVKNGINYKNIDVPMLNVLKKRVVFALKFLAMRNQIQLDKQSRALNALSKNDFKYFLREMAYFLDQFGQTTSSGKCIRPICENEYENGSNKKHSDRKRFLQFVANTIELCDGDGTAFSKKQKRGNRRRKRQYIGNTFSYIEAVLAACLLALFAVVVFAVCGILCHRYRQHANVPTPLMLGGIDAINIRNRTMLPNDITAEILKVFSEIPQIVVESPQELECAICLSSIDTGRKVKPLPTCKHMFHKKCIKGWIQGGHNACPICRQEIANVSSLAQTRNANDLTLSVEQMDNNNNDSDQSVTLADQNI